MPRPLPSPNIHVPLEPLTHSAFSPFGTVIENPLRCSSPLSSQSPPPPPLASVTANQGTATKYIDVSHLTNHYGLAPSRKPAKAVMNMFVCKPRELQSLPEHSITANTQTPSAVGASEGGSTEQSQKRIFPITILERHPFTPQTFIPMGLSASATASTAYLVIVAPTLPTPSTSTSTSKPNNRPLPYPRPEPRRRRSIADTFTRARPTPFTNTTTPPPSPPQPQPHTSSAPKPKGPGPPDLTRLRAFLATGSQAVTYGPGTWHAPMAVVGGDDGGVDFVVVQYANGVAAEDCQELGLEAEGGGKGLGVVVGDGAGFGLAAVREKARL
ncbi:hypothetical protein LTR28_008366 [Elasticomyces elasticus]|nr:hypothetical protein LTR28_008366 [Elasticomyces elasticus]